MGFDRIREEVGRKIGYGIILTDMIKTNLYPNYHSSRVLLVNHVDESSRDHSEQCLCLKFSKSQSLFRTEKSATVAQSTARTWSQYPHAISIQMSSRGSFHNH